MCTRVCTCARVCTREHTHPSLTLGGLDSGTSQTLTLRSLLKCRFTSWVRGMVPDSAFLGGSPVTMVVHEPCLEEGVCRMACSSCWPSAGAGRSHEDRGNFELRAPQLLLTFLNKGHCSLGEQRGPRAGWLRASGLCLWCNVIVKPKTALKSVF